MEYNMTHMSLFSGIGAIDLASHWAGFTTIGQCEIDDYATKVLEKNFPNISRWRDIRDVTNKSFRERTGISTGELTLLSGGFPCQPHSVAGKRKASADERDLWDEFARVIREIRPKWVLGENVRGLLGSEFGRYFGRILRDMDEMGYNVGWCSYGAVDVGAYHRRERIFIVANSICERWNSVDKNEKVRRNIAVTKNADNSETKPGFNAEPYNIWLCGNGKITKGSGRTERNDDGLSSGVDRLRCLGNAVVPQQVYPILKSIAELEKVARRHGV